MPGMSSNQYVVVQGWMCNELNLTGNELLIFSLIYGFSQDGMSKFTGGRNYIAKTFNISLPTVDKVLKNLVKKKLVQKYRQVTNNVTFNHYSVNLVVVKDFYGGSKETLPEVVKDFYGGSKETLPNNINNNISNNKEYIYTSNVAPVQSQTILDMFNEICKSYPRATKLSESRRKAIKARLKMYSIDDFKQLFKMAEGSSFLKGGNNHNWSANFDWLIKDANMAKVLDGNYSDAGEKQQEESERRKKEPVSEGFRAIYERNMRRKEMEERGEIPEEPFDPTRLPFQ